MQGPDGAMESGIVIKNLSKVMLQITFGPDGRTVINASAHEYASAALLLRLYEDGCVTKVIAFCPTIAACRRVMALFKAMVSRRISELKEAAEDAAQTQLDILRDINCGHVHQSESKDGEIIRKQARHVRQQLIGQFLTGQFEVLFNTNLLSTGVDFPCCDAVLLISPTKDPRTIMQRWGRALRYVACKPNKKGILAMVSTDPYEPSEDIEEREEALGISDDTVFKNDQAATEAQFDAMYRVAECAVDPSRRTIGVIFRLIGGWIQAARTSGSKGSEEKKQKQKSLADILLMAKKSEGTTLSLTPQHEQLLGRIFKAHTVRLVADPLWWWNDLVEDLARWRASNPNEASPPANQGQYGVGDKLSKARGRLRDIYSILESKGLLYPDTTAGIAELERALKESKGGNLGYVVPTKNLVQKIEDTLQDKKWWHRMTVEEKFKAAKKKLKDWNSSFSDRYKEVETGKLIGKERSNPVGPDEKPPAIFNLVLQKKDVKAAEEIARKLKEKQYSELLTEDERREISRLLFFEDADVLVWQNTFDSRTAWARLAIQLRYWKRYKMWCDGVFLDNNEPPYILKTRDERDNEWFGDIGRKFKEAMGVCGTFKGEGTLKKSSQFTTEPTEEEIESIGIALGIDEAYNWWDETVLIVENGTTVEKACRALEAGIEKLVKSLKVFREQEVQKWKDKGNNGEPKPRFPSDKSGTAKELGSKVNDLKKRDRNGVGLPLSQEMKQMVAESVGFPKDFKWCDKKPETWSFDPFIALLEVYADEREKPCGLPGKNVEINGQNMYQMTSRAKEEAKKIYSRKSTNTSNGRDTEGLEEGNIADCDDCDEDIIEEKIQKIAEIAFGDHHYIWWEDSDPLWWWNDLVEDLARWRASNPNEASPPANQGQYGVGDKLSKARGRLRDIYSILESKGLLYPDTTAGIAELERALKESKGGNLGYVVPTKNLVQKIEDTLQDKKWWHRMTVEEKFKAAKKKLKDWNSSFSDRYKEVETGKLIGKERSNPVGPDEKPPAIFNLVLQKKDVKAAEEIARKLKEKQYSELLTEDERREISRLLFFEDADVLVWQNTFDSRTAWARLAIQLRYWKRYKMWCDGVFLDNNEPPYILKTRDERDNEWFGDIGRKFKEAMGVCGTFKGEGTLKKSSQFTTEPTEEEIESIGIALGIDEAYNWWDEEFLRVEEKKNKKTQHKSVT